MLRRIQAITVVFPKGRCHQLWAEDQAEQDGTSWGFVSWGHRYGDLGGNARGGWLTAVTGLWN